MQLQEIERLIRKYWKPGWGSIASDEAAYIQSLIERYRPRHFIEIGTASGLSGGLIACFLDENEGESFTTIDHDNTFFGDMSRENGFLLADVYNSDRVKLKKLSFKTALDVPDLSMQFDMGFVDANHQHPWPLIDTLCLYPFMSGPKIVVHHDLSLYRKQDVACGIGPKYLFDQFPELYRHRSDANEGNIFSIDLSGSRECIEGIASDGFYLPWTLRTPLQKKFIDSLRQILQAHYSENLCSIFEECLKRFNVHR